jgi:hypothetical protein
MSRLRRQAILILFGVAVLTLSIIVIIRNRSPDDEMLAVIGIIGGLAIVVVSLPVPGH